MAGARDVVDNASGPARRARDDINKLTRLLPGSDATPSPPPDPPALGALVDRVMSLLLAENARLVDHIHGQAEEIGRLQEQLRQLEQQVAALGWGR
jgi:hypothetical protein